MQGPDNDPIVDVQIHVARIEERVAALTEHLRELKDTYKEHREEQNAMLSEISKKIGDQNSSIAQYKHDRNWVVGIFGAAYAFLLVWVKKKFDA